MNEETKKIIDEQLASLPLEIREAISRIPWQSRVRDIAKREGLEADKAESFETETMFILYGFEQPGDFTQNLMRELGIEEEQAERLSGLVSKEIVEDIEKQYEMISALAPETSNVSPAPKAEIKETEAPDLLNIPPEIMARQIKLPSEPVDRLPEVVPGQIAHDVPRVESAPTPTAPTPNTTQPAATPAVTPAALAPRSIVEEKLSQVTIAESQAPKPTSYPSGQDPYREPLE